MYPVGGCIPVRHRARVVESVDTSDLKSEAERRAGSTPAPGISESPCDSYRRGFHCSICSRSVARLDDAGIQQPAPDLGASADGEGGFSPRPVKDREPGYCHGGGPEGINDRINELKCE